MVDCYADMGQIGQDVSKYIHTYIHTYLFVYFIYIHLIYCRYFTQADHKSIIDNSFVQKILLGCRKKDNCMNSMAIGNLNIDNKINKLINVVTSV